MNTANRYQTKSLLYIAVAFTMVTALVLGMLSSIASAATVTSVGSNIETVVDEGGNLVLSVRMQKSETPVTALEIDHNLGGLSLPEFWVYANTANPYGDDAADFTAAGVEVTYTETSTEGLWIIDFGPTVTEAITDAIEADVIPTADFYLVLRNGDEAVWGSMSPITTENTFTFNLVEGTVSANVGALVEALPPEVQAPVEEAPAAPAATPQVVVPGVPNTALGL